MRNVAALHQSHLQTEASNVIKQKKKCLWQQSRALWQQPPWLCQREYHYHPSGNSILSVGVRVEGPCDKLVQDEPHLYPIRLQGLALLSLQWWYGCYTLSSSCIGYYYLYDVHTSLFANVAWDSGFSTMSEAALPPPLHKSLSRSIPNIVAEISASHVLYFVLAVELNKRQTTLPFLSSAWWTDQRVGDQ